MSAVLTLNTYPAPVTITMDLTGLAASATFVAGRESTQIDNTTNKFVDAKVFGRFIGGTTPTLPCVFNVYLWGADVSLATTAIDVLDGTDSAETLTNTTVLGSALILARSIPILVNTSNITYDIAPFNVCEVFSHMPNFWGLYCAHNMTAALKTDAGNTNSFRFQGVTYLST
jgi:hypothetical protein